MTLQKSFISELVNVRDLPSDIRGFLDSYKGKKFIFQDEIESLEKKLSIIKSSDPKEQYTIDVFLCLIYFHLYRYRECLKLIFKLDKLKNGPRLKKLLFSIKYSIIYLDNILFIISADYSNNVCFNSLRESHKRIRFKYIKDYNDYLFRKDMNDYEQIFIFGHGDDEFIKIGNDLLNNDYLNDVLKYKRIKVPVLGIFSCGNAFSAKKLSNKVDYFITDNELSVSEFSELFIYGYIRNYLKTGNIIGAFEMGQITPAFRAVDTTTIELYEAGKLIRS